MFNESDSDDREQAIADLAVGAIDALCSVDMLTEGVDIPAVDRVVMLRPTESPVVFLQQLGRGLRRDEATGKQRLTVIDFVGNHRVFLARLQRLWSMAGAAERDLVRELVAGGGVAALGDMCSIRIELGAVDLLRQMEASRMSPLERAYAALRDAQDERPRAGQLRRRGHRLNALPATYETWFDFVADQGDLSDDEHEVLEHGRAWFAELQGTDMKASFKMIALEAFIEVDALATEMTIDDNAERSLEILRRAPDLQRDVREPLRGGFHEARDERAVKAWRTYWKGNPIRAWVGKRRMEARYYFREEGKRIVPVLPIASGQERVFTDMTRELLDYKLADYRMRTARPAMRPFAAYPDLRAAAGVRTNAALAIDADEVMLPSEREPADLLAVRAAGDSMDGGRAPLRDGDWLIMKPARGASLSAVQGKIALVETPDRGEGSHHQVKRVVSTERGWMLRSDNRDYPEQPVGEGAVVSARLVEVIRPEDLAPAVGAALADDQLDDAFGFAITPRDGRYGGHLFRFLTGADRLTGRDHLRCPPPEHPGETAFALARRAPGEPWHYVGVARWSEQDGWRIPPIDDDLWRALAQS